mgnify:CR=1 FL=1
MQVSKGLFGASANTTAELVYFSQTHAIGPVYDNCVCIRYVEA